MIKQRQASILLPFAVSTSSFFGLLLIMFLTDPVQNISYAILFFATLLVLLFSIGHLLLGLSWGEVSRRSRSKILIISVLLVIIMMFRSAGSLHWVDVLVMLLLGGGLLFYSARRS